jgi:hypothetical protein
LEKHEARVPLDDETVVAIDVGIAQARRGEFASAEEIVALWRATGLRPFATRERAQRDLAEILTQSQKKACGALAT